MADDRGGEKALSTIIDNLMILVGVDGKEAKKGIDQVNGYLDGLTSKIKGMAVGFAGMYAIGQTFSNYLSEADALGKFSDSIGHNIEDIHAWQEAVKRSGGSAESFQGSIKGLSAQLNKMALMGSSKIGNMLEQMGISTTENGKARDTFAVVEDLADKFKEMDALEATAKGQLIGFDSGFVALLREGRDGVKDLVNKQKELGVYTEEDAKVTAEFNDQLDDSKQAFMGVAKTVMVMIVPAMKQLAEWTTKFFVYLRQHQTFVKAFFIMIATLITAMLIPTLVELFATLLANPITWVVLALAGLALIIEDLVTYAEGGDSAFADFWDAIFVSPEGAMEAWEDLKQAVWDVVLFVQNHAEDFKFIFAMAMPLIALFIANWDKIKPVIIKVIQVVADFIKQFRFSMQGALLTLDVFISVLKNFVRNVEEVFVGMCEAIQTFILAMLTWMLSQFGLTLDDVGNAWNIFKDTAINALNALFAPINAVADAISGAIGGAISWAMEKWNDLKRAVGMGVSAGDVNPMNGGGGGNSNTTWNVTMNGIANGSQAVSTFRQGVGSRYNAGQSNNGAY